MQSQREETPPLGLEHELHRLAKHRRFGRSALAREGSLQADAILMPAAAGAGREDEELAVVALDEVAGTRRLDSQAHAREDRELPLSTCSLKARISNSFRLRRRTPQRVRVA